MHVANIPHLGGCNCWKVHMGLEKSTPDAAHQLSEDTQENENSANTGKRAGSRK